MPEWQSTGLRHIWMPYSQMKTAPRPIAVDDAEGVCLHLSDGRRLIDAMASWWSVCHGYRHPHLVNAIQRQAETLSHVMFGGVNHEPALRLARRLAAILPGDLNRVFFSDSGSVAVEVAMKMAVQFYRNRGQAGRTRFVSFRNAYHGDTTGAMSLCDPLRSMHKEFGDALLQQFSVELPTNERTTGEFDRLLETHGDQIAGVFIEPIVQGAGGMRFHSPETLRRIADACRRHGVLLIADELATGFGRTGKMFAIEHLPTNESGDAPVDIVCLGKSMTGGMVGMAATVATDRVFDAFWSEDPSKALMHGPTFMANPIACAAALASLDLFEREPRLDQVAEIESMLRQSLAPCREIEGVVDVRTLGAVGVIQVERLDHVDRLRAEFVDHGVWIRPFGDCIYTTPAYVISPDELSQVCDVMHRVTRRWASWSRAK